VPQVIGDVGIVATRLIEVDDFAAANLIVRSATGSPSLVVFRMPSQIFRRFGKVGYAVSP